MGLYFPCHSCNCNQSYLSPSIKQLFSLTTCLCISFSKINIFWTSTLQLVVLSNMITSILFNRLFHVAKLFDFCTHRKGRKIWSRNLFTPPLKWLWTAQFFKQILLYKVCSPEKPPSPRLDSRPTVAHCAPALAPSWGVLLPPRDQPWEC